MRVLVLGGAEHSERDVSLVSALSVARALAESGNAVIVLDPASTVQIITGPTSDPADIPKQDIPEAPPEQDSEDMLRRQMFVSLTEQHVLEQIMSADLVYVAMHGGWGADGHLQAFLEMAGVSYTGAPSGVCSLTWDKDVALTVLRSAGIPTAERVRYEPDDGASYDSILAMLEGGPVVIKPASGGSSVDVRIVYSENELVESVRQSAGGPLIAERFLPGREFTVGVVGSQILPVVEIEFEAPIFDYQAKYQPDGAKEICPADIPCDLSSRLQELALNAHMALGFTREGYSRTDFRCDANGEPVCLELNALPGLTPGSLLPLAAKATGWSYEDLVHRIMNLSVSRKAGD